MPLIQSPSKKAFKKNVEQEMRSNPSPEKRAQNLAIAYSVQRKNKRKKMADGGMVEQNVNDKDELMDNSHKKPMSERDNWENDGEDQASKDSKHEMSSPKPEMGDDSSMREEEMHLMSKEEPDENRSEQPKSSYDEMHEHGESPSNPDEAMSHTGESESDMLRRHAMERASFARGGQVLPKNRLSDRGHQMEESDEEPQSIADAIMRKRNDVKMMADGGMVDIDENAEEEPNQYYHQNEDVVLKENYDKDMDDVSQPMDSNEHSDKLDDEDEHDMVSQIRKKIKYKY